MKLPKWPNPNNFHHINLGLDRINELLNRLGNPQLKLPKTIHIAGTNGKGSTLAFLKTIYEQAGYKVHRYTSPHLIEFNERIELSGTKISDDLLQSYLNRCQDACSSSPEIDITFFEATTACAFLAFSENPADILLLETGMGGEFDATNVLPNVFQSIITPISFDHQQFLGDSLDEISKAKAGIIKKNCPIICANQELLALNVISKKAKELNSKLVLTKDFFPQTNIDLDSIKISLFGSHQIENAKTAICSIKNQTDFKISDQNIKDGLENTKWKARLEKINSGNFIKKLSRNFQIYLDGSHNVQGATTINEFLENFQKHQRIVIFQMLNDKNCEEFLRIISSKINLLLIPEIAKDPRFRKAKDILKIAKDLKISAKTIENFTEAFNEIEINFNNQKTVILICGSLYFASEFLIANQQI
ncbi:MAG: bifunctional folylpolyglutamate synthase/dihydrofolate synthase [Alphaproteobacteria bacterium]|nr:bifunctional folylpolyglutamate synthase/dihydrofolate synthase [Alphaproteobacteria bacterium]